MEKSRRLQSQHENIENVLASALTRKCVTIDMHYVFSFEGNTSSSWLDIVLQHLRGLDQNHT